MSTTLAPATPAVFDCDGYRLMGTLRQARSPIGFVILNQGPLDRSGAHKISDRIARALNELSCPTLQFDARGVGESEGDWDIGTAEEPIQALYKRIFDGAWVPDTNAAIEFFRSATGVEQVVLIGLCGGASTALHVGARRPDVLGMVMVGMPVRVQFDTATVDDLVDTFVKSEADLYFSKLFASAAWKRLLTMQSDYKTLCALLWRRLRDLGPRSSRKLQSVDLGISESFDKAIKARKRLLFVYAENDYLWTEFRELFLPHQSRSRDQFSLLTIPESNHTLTETRWQQQFYTGLIDWIRPSLAGRVS